MSEHRDFLRDFFEHAPIGFHSFGSDRTIIDINQTELNMLGYKKEEIVDKKNWADLIIPAEIPLFEIHWQQINTEGEVRNLPYTVVRKDGKHLSVLLNATARFDRSGKLLNTRGSIIDITERRQLARRIKVSKNELNRQKMVLEYIQKNIEETIYPLMEKLKRRGSSLDRRNLSLLEKYLQDLTSGLALKLMDKRWRLSAREIEICKMLRSGLQTKDIADLLCTSMRTVEHHRNHIRKKFGISRSSADLTSYLKVFSL